MELHFIKNCFYPGSRITTGFGWDKYTFPKSPRIHHAIDRAGPGNVYVPMEVDRVEWIDEDALGCSVLRLISGGAELRMLHFIKDEVDSNIMWAVKHNAALPGGNIIGPTGNKGLSVSSNGGSGRHLHYQLLLEPGVFDDQLDSLCSEWRSDSIETFKKQYGKPFVSEVAKRQILWMNDVAMEKFDPITGKRQIVVDPVKFFGL